MLFIAPKQQNFVSIFTRFGTPDNAHTLLLDIEEKANDYLSMAESSHKPY